MKEGEEGGKNMEEEGGGRGSARIHARRRRNAQNQKNRE